VEPGLVGWPVARAMLRWWRNRLRPVRCPTGGAAGVGSGNSLTPDINSKEETEEIVAAVQFPPMGQRSFGSPWAGLAFGLSMPEYRQQANSETIVFAQVESAAALGRLDGILGVRGLDGVFVGPVDLAISLGLDPNP
jgi:4-hydroxy-2-oxoheptanedioate aldolase